MATRRGRGDCGSVTAVVTGWYYGSGVARAAARTGVVGVEEELGDAEPLVGKGHALVVVPLVLVGAQDMSPEVRVKVGEDVLYPESAASLFGRLPEVRLEVLAAPQAPRVSLQEARNASRQREALVATLRRLLLPSKASF